MPLITGGFVLTGAPDATVPTSAEVALATPYGLVAVTVTRSREPRSEAPAVYVEPVAPAIAVQLAPPSNDRCQT